MQELYRRIEEVQSLVCERFFTLAQNSLLCDTVPNWHGRLVRERALQALTVRNPLTEAGYSPGGSGSGVASFCA